MTVLTEVVPVSNGQVIRTTVSGSDYDAGYDPDTDAPETTVVITTAELPVGTSDAKIREVQSEQLRQAIHDINSEQNRSY